MPASRVLVVSPELRKPAAPPSPSLSEPLPGDSRAHLHCRATPQLPSFSPGIGPVSRPECASAWSLTGGWTPRRSPGLSDEVLLPSSLSPLHGSREPRGTVQTEGQRPGRAGRRAGHDLERLLHSCLHFPAGKRAWTSALLLVGTEDLSSTDHCYLIAKQKFRL